MSISVMLGAVVLIALIMILIMFLRGKPLNLPVHGMAAATMFVAGIASIVVTHMARSHKQYYALSGLLGVTTIAIVPIAVVVVTHVIAEKTTAHFVFSQIIVYYLMFLPVGAWLILPPKEVNASQVTQETEDKS